MTNTQPTYRTIEIDATHGVVVRQPGGRLVTPRPARIEACKRMERALNANTVKRAASLGA